MKSEEKIPILKIEDTLLTSVQIPLHDKLALEFQEELLNSIVQTKVKGLVIDISAIELVDSFITRILVEIARMANLMGVKTVIVGMRPEIAITLVDFGVQLTGIETALNLETGLKRLRTWRSR